MATQQRTHAVGSGVVHPEEDEDAKRQDAVEVDAAVGRCLEGEHVDAGEGQGDVHLREHGVGPVVDGVWLLQVELADEEIDHGEQIGNEHSRGGQPGAVASHGQEEVGACHGGDEAVDADVFAVVDEGGKLPDGHRGDEGEQKDHGHRVDAEACHHDGNEDDAADGTCDEVLHLNS